ncbi:unnamed protein product [Discosporangium mesarthrocarpum]
MADAETVRRQRQQQLEDKRRRLDELRKRKKKQEKVTTVRHDGALETPSKTSAGPVGPSTADGGAGMGADFDAYIKSLLSTPAAGEGSGGGSLKVPGDGGSDTSGLSREAMRGGVDPPRHLRPRTLQVTPCLAEVNVLPKVMEFYDKGCQTEEESFVGLQGSQGKGPGDNWAHTHMGDGSRGSSDGLMNTAMTPEKPRHQRRMFGGKGSKGKGGVAVYDLPEGGEVPTLGIPAQVGGPTLIVSPGQRRISASAPAGVSVGVRGGTPILSSVPPPPPPPPPPLGFATKTLSAEEKKDITQSDHFQDFLRRTSLVLERALGEAAALDVLVDYSQEEQAGDAGRGFQGQRLSEAMQFHEDRWCADRALTDIQWSMHRAELVLASYSAKGHGLQPGLSSLHVNSDPDGLVLVWSLAMQHRPEYQLSSQSPVLTARFHPFNPHVVLGGTYSGQVMVWDTRVKVLPVQRTPLSTSGHTHPVYNLELIGTESAPSLMTASTDGCVSFWNPSQLSQPLQTMGLRNKGKPVSVSSMALAETDEHQELIVGSESGGVFTTPIHSRTSGTVQEYPGHYGMVTSVDVNHSSSKMLRRLLLSSSLDWTTRLWHLDRPSKQPIQSLTHGTYDYVCDAKWSPKHPALFMTANISGELALWNLNHSMEEPLAPPVKVAERCALTRMAWSSDGRKLCVGDAKGYAHVFNVDQETALPRPDEDLKLEGTLSARGFLV